MSRRFVRRPLVLSLLALHGLPAMAEEAPVAAIPVAPQSESAPQVLQEVVISGQADSKSYTPTVSTVGGKTPTALRDVPQAVTVLKRQILDDQAATTLTDALRNVPGITISAGEGGNIGDNINLRGFSARTDIYLDGFRDRGQYTRDVFALDAVEILKGPSSMLFGRGSTGGVINQVSKRPDLENRGEITASVGTDDYYRTTVDVNRAVSDSSAFRIAAFAQDMQSTRDVVEQTGFGVAPSFRFGIGTPTEVTLSAVVQRNRDVPDYGFPLLNSGTGTVSKPIEAAADRYFGYQDDYFDQDVTVLGVSLQHKFSQALTLRNRTQYNQVITDTSPTPLGSLSVVAGACTTTWGSTPRQAIPLDCLQAQRQDRPRTTRDTSFFNQTDLIARFATGTVQHVLSSGIEVGLDTFSNDYDRFTPTSQTVNLGNPEAKNRPGVRSDRYDAETTAYTTAAYVNDQLALNEHWKVVAGARADRFRAESFRYDAPPTTTTPNPSLLEHTDDMVSTRAGVIWQPDAVQAYYVSYGTSFNPSAETITQQTSTANLDAEENRSQELGAKWSLLDDSLFLNTALFRVEKTNARTTNPLTSEVTLDGHIRVQGAELGVTGKLSETWQVVGGYTYLDSEILASADRSGTAPNFVYAEGKHYQNTPQHSATLWTTWRFLPDWEVGGGVFGATERFVNNYETAAVDGFVRGDATLAYLQKQYGVRLNVLNVSDEKYYEAASGGRAIPARGRTVVLTYNYHF